MRTFRHLPCIGFAKPVSPPNRRWCYHPSRQTRLRWREGPPEGPATEWLHLVYWLIGVMLMVRLIGNIAPLQPPWMQREPSLRYAFSFLIHALMWPIHVGRDRYDE